MPTRSGRLPLWSRAARWFRTVRHLRPRQAWHQALHRLRPRWAGPAAVAGGPAGRAPAPAWPAGRAFSPPATGPANTRDAVLAGRLTFQNRREALGFPPDWNRAGLPHLWRYHLHYHEFLWSLPFEQARDAAADWIARHPRGPGRVGWEPYPTSLRLGVWCTLFLGRHRDRTLSDERFHAALWRSIHEQAQHLTHNLEWRLLGNHLLENAVALALAGSCFDAAAARGWLCTGIALLAREAPEQILADGGHVERSPMYQCRVVHLLLLLRATGVPALRALVQPHLAAAARAVASLTHPDGGIALLNDSALGVHPEPKRLMREAGLAPPAPGTFALPATGYYGARTRAGHYVVCDAGPIGPDYQPGHGHADLLSFELSLRGVRVVVDSGVSTYEAGPSRDYCRSTRAHNTVAIEEHDQVEVWGAFRVGRRCRPRDVVWTAGGDAFELSAMHDGYRVLRGRPTHARTFRWRGSGGLEIEDRVDASRAVRCVARLHLHPDCRLGRPAGGACMVDFPRGRVRVSWVGWDTATGEASWFSPAFGVVRRNPCLALASASARLRGAIRIELVPDVNGG